MSEHAIRTNHLLEKVIDLLEEIRNRELKILKVEQAVMGYLSQIAHDLNPKPVTGFIIRRDTMNPIVPGSSAVYTATVVPADATLAAPFPVWTSSDTVNAPVTADATGLVATVAVPDTAAPPAEGLSFTLSINYTNPNGEVATGSITDVIMPKVVPPINVTSFTITRTA